MASRNNTNATSSSPSLCSKGCGFFGSSATRNMCSKCYKDFLVQTEAKLQSLTIAAPTSTALVSPSPPSSSVGHDYDQLDNSSGSGTTTRKTKSRCECCKKRVGLTGFECRCGGTFCGLHRYPEEHACGFDFKAFGRAHLAMQNPRCNANKMPERA